jgi:hypothetical protein
MGIVWRAKDERLGRVIAVKQLIIRPGLSPAQTDEARRRAMREARIAARLQHRNAIAMLDVAEYEGDPYLVMEFLASKSLSAVLAEQGTLPPEQVAAIGAQIASALAAAHAVGIVHRDVKPANILLDDEGTVKITDFGISRALGDGTITETGMIAGTPAYLAPEIARGKDPSHASDVFSLGATLYHAIEGSPPFGLNPNPLALLHAVASGRIDPPANAGALTPTLMSLLRTDPVDRPTMAETATTLKTPMRAPIEPPTMPAYEPPTMQVRPVAPPAKPAPAQPRPTQARTTESRPAQAPTKARHGVVIAAIVGVLLLAGVLTVVLVNGGNGGSGGAASASDRPSSTQTAEPIATVEKVASYSAAGQLVIDYYGDASADQRWDMLGPNGKAAFGDRSAFDGYWSKFQYVSSRNARGVTPNADGSVTVPVDVTTKTAAGEDTRKRTVKVVMLGGKYLIDSDSR